MNARDKKTFDFVESQMRRFAGLYGLQFKGLLTMHKQKFARHYYGLCYPSGRIAIRIRWPNGRPLQAYAVLDTMAHELAHLRYFTHSSRWFQLHARILFAMSHSDLYPKLLRRLDKPKH